jgi:hypothetical protein
MAVSTPAKLGIGVLVLAGAFLAGYVPATLAARTARADQDRLTHKLALATLQVQLGMMSYEVNRDNYGLAAQLATPFFDGVRSAIADPGEQAVTQSLQAVLARRDEITSDLAQVNAGVKTKIAQLYADLYRLAQAQPPSATPPAVSP